MALGASIYDVRTEGGPSKEDIVSNLSKGGCVNLRTRGEGVKKSKFVADVINGSPPTPPPLPRLHNYPPERPDMSLNI